MQYYETQFIQTYDFNGRPNALTLQLDWATAVLQYYPTISTINYLHLIIATTIKMINRVFIYLKF